MMSLWNNLKNCIYLPLKKKKKITPVEAISRFCFYLYILHFTYICALVYDSFTEITNVHFYTQNSLDTPKKDQQYHFLG